MKKNFFVINFLVLIFLFFNTNLIFSKEISVVVDNFDSRETVNKLGGISGTFYRDPNSKEEYCNLSFEPDFNSNGNILKLEYRVSENGFVGYFTKLNNFDARMFENISFKIKSDKPKLTIKLELKSGEEVGKFFLENISQKYKKITIPLNKFIGINNFKNLKEFVIVFEDNLLDKNKKEGVLYLDDIKFTAKKKYYENKLVELSSELKEKDFSFIDNMSDDEFLDFIERKTFDYFLKEVGKDTGFVKDRSTKDSPSSIAATGFGLAAICIGVERGWISYDEGRNIVLKTLTSIINLKDVKEGFYYHFVDKDSGVRVWNSELSSIDTALLLCGIIVAKEYFNDKEINTLSGQIISQVNWRWMMDEKTKLLYMGWDPENGFKNYPLWDTYAEMLVMYILGIGAEKNSLPEISWHKINRPVKNYKNYSYIYSAGESMFVYQYSHAFIDFRNISDKYTNYWDNSIKAILRGYQFCKEMADKSLTYKKFWGISASDGPFGYKNYGATIFAQDGTIAPYAVCASVPFLGKLAIDTLRDMLKEYNERVFGEYGFVSAINLDKNYFSDEFVGIDLGITILMIENYRSGFVWKQFMKNDIVNRGLKRAGFKEGKSNLDLNLLIDKPEKVDIKLNSIEVKYRGEKNILIDGDLSDWGEMEHFYKFDLKESLEYGIIKNSLDLDAKFNFYWDEKNLFFAILVVDDTIIDENKGKEIYLNDCVELYFNPREKKLNWGDRTNFQLGFSATKGIEKMMCYSWFQDENPVLKDKVRFVSKKTDNGYIIEASINWEYLNIYAKKHTEFGFSVAVHDIDDKENKTDKKINFSFKNVDDKLYLGTMKLVK